MPTPACTCVSLHDHGAGRCVQVSKKRGKSAGIVERLLVLLRENQEQLQRYHALRTAMAQPPQLPRHGDASTSTEFGTACLSASRSAPPPSVSRAHTRPVHTRILDTAMSRGSAGHSSTDTATPSVRTWCKRLA